jgi:hypothetical protein
VGQVVQPKRRSFFKLPVALVTPSVFAAGAFLNPIPALTIRKLSRRTGGRDRRHYRATGDLKN